MRLIDADALKADLRQYFTDGVLDGISARLAFNQILHDIDNAPTVLHDNYSMGYQDGVKKVLSERPIDDLSEYSDKLWKKAYERGKAEGRKTGHWIKTISENGVTSAARCSECGFGDNRYMLFRYCPNCGAKMTKEAENE